MTASATRAHAGRTAAVCTLISALVGSLLALSAGPAHAAGYRYWSFWEQQGGSQGWSYATQGPSLLRPDDGAVIGFRFSVSEDSADAAKPRSSSGFDTICGGTEEKSGSKRIALVIDFGTATDAPSGEKPPKARTACARVGGDASAAEALAAEAKPLRYNSDALLCAIAGYPDSGCGEQVSDSGSGQDGTADTSEEEQGTENAADDGDDGSGGNGGGGLSTGLGVAAGVGAVALLGAGALWQARRRRA